MLLFFFHRIKMTYCLCCRCHLVISTARAQAGERWCESVYPCLSWYMVQLRKDSVWRTSSPGVWTARYIINENSPAGRVAPEITYCTVRALQRHSFMHIMSDSNFSSSSCSYIQFRNNTNCCGTFNGLVDVLFPLPFVISSVDVFANWD